MDGRAGDLGRRASRSSHAHGRWIEIRLTSKRINQLEDDRVLRRARTSDWVMVDEEERELILELAGQAASANAPGSL